MSMDNAPDISENVARLLELWNTDPGFQSSLKSARARVVEEWGLSLDKTEQDVLNSINFTMPDDELDEFMKRQIG